MIRIKHNKDNTIHGTYRSPDITLKLLLENKSVCGNALKHKIDTFLEGDDGTLVFSFDGRVPNVMLKLERETNSYQVSFTRKMEIKKENMDDIVSLLQKMASACDSGICEDTSVSSSINLLAESR